MITHISPEKLKALTDIASDPASGPFRFNALVEEGFCADEAGIARATDYALLLRIEAAAAAYIAATDNLRSKATYTPSDITKLSTDANAVQAAVQGIREALTAYHARSER